MCDQDEAGNRGGQDEFPAPSAPDNRGGKKSQAKRKIIIEKADVERPTVSKHRQAWQQKPRRTTPDSGDEGELTPKKDERAKRDQNCLCRREPALVRTFAERYVEPDA